MTTLAAAVAELMKGAGGRNARTERTAGAEEAGRLLKTPPVLAVGDVGRRRGELSGPRGTVESAGPAVNRADRLGTNLAAVFGDLVRGVIREELYAAFADHRFSQALATRRIDPLKRCARTHN